MDIFIIARLILEQKNETGYRDVIKAKNAPKKCYDSIFPYDNSALYAIILPGML